MWYLWVALIILLLLALAALALKVVKQYEQGVLYRLGKVIAVRPVGLTVIIPFVDVFPAPLMSTIGELGTFLARENNAASAVAPPGSARGVVQVVNGTPLATAVS